MWSVRGLAAASIVVLLTGLPACSSDSDGGSGSPDGGMGAGAGAGAGGRASSGSGGRAGSSGGRTAAGDGGAGPSGGAPTGDGTTYGDVYSGGEFHLGPVDWDETEWHNACAPLTKYAPAVRSLEGELLAGLWNGIPNVAGYCDACIQVETAEGKSALLRVVTYGDTTPNSIDVSPAAYEILNSGEYPRNMTWQFAKCPDTGDVLYEFQTGSSQWWTSLWVRNARVPLEEVAVRSANHPAFAPLERGGDGTLTDGAGFGEGPFSIRLTGVDGQEIVHDFDWPADGIAGSTLTGEGNFQ